MTGHSQVKHAGHSAPRQMKSSRQLPSRVTAPVARSRGAANLEIRR
jgi:hypothetical protein